jgi:hypothetical protein
VRLIGIPQPGSYFGVWGNAASGNTNPLYFAVTSPTQTVSSLFAALDAGKAALTVSPDGFGRVIVSPRTNAYDLGATVMLTAVPDAGQMFTGWSGDANGGVNPLVITMEQSKWITASFTRKPALIFTGLDGLNASGFRFTLAGEWGATYQVQGSSDLITWLPLGFLTNAYGTAQFSDASATNASFKFYRSVLQPSCTAAPANLVSWWRAENDAADAIGANNGTLAGSTSFGAGMVGEAFVFHGTNDGLVLGNPANMQLQDFSIEGWAKRADPSVATANGESGGSFLGYDTGGYSFGVFNDGRLRLTKVGYDSVESPALLTDTNFHHVAVAKAGSTVVFYLDGVAYLAPAYDPGFIYSSAVVIGARGDLSHSFLGSIDELSFSSRALSATEIQAIYGAGASGKCR